MSVPVITWEVEESVCLRPAVLSGYPIGEEVDAQFVIDWGIPGGVVTKVEQVMCLDGATSFDPYLKIDDSSISFLPSGTVIFKGRLFSYARTINLRAAISTSAQRTFVCNPLPLTIKPGSELVNPPWSKPEGDTKIVIPFRKNRVEVSSSGAVIDFWSERAQWLAPLTTDDVRSVTLDRLKEFHPHATEDLKPRVRWELKESDGAGLTIYLENLRPYERYVLQVNTGSNEVVYIRTGA